MSAVKSKCGKTCEWIFIYSMLFVGVSAFLNKLSMAEALLVLVYQIFIYAVPGMAVILLLGLKVHTDVEWIGYIFVAGYCCNIILYYAVVPFGLQPYTRVVGCLLAVLSMVIIYKKRGLLVCMEDQNGMKICSMGVLCYTLFMFVAYNGNGLTPNLTGVTDYYTYHRDVLYWIGNLNSLMKQYPPINPREYTDGIYNYHYFSSIQLAVEALFTEVSTAVTCIGLYFFATIPMIIFGTYLFAKNIFKEGRIIAWAMCALLITSGAENITKIEQVRHYVLTSFGTDYGLGILLFLMLVLYRYCECARKAQGIICVILLTVLTGTKAPYAAMALCGFGGICLALLLQKKVLRSLLFGGASLTTFGITYYFVCNTKGYVKGSSQKLINLVIRTDPNMPMIEACLRKAGKEIMNFLLMKPNVILPLIVLLIFIVCRKRHINLFGIACLFMLAVGFGINAIITMPSNQQTYFALAALVPAWCFVIAEGNSIDWSAYRGKNIYKFARKTMICVFLLGVIGFLAGYTYNGDRFNVIYSMDDGIKMIARSFIGVRGEQFSKESADRGNILDEDEYETMLRLARDGEPEAIILYILPEEREGKRSFRKKLIGSFSRKYIMNGREEDGEALECDAKEYKKMYDIGVRYILIDYWKEKGGAIQEDFAEEIYVGRQIKLYRLNNMQ